MTNPSNHRTLRRLPAIVFAAAVALSLTNGNSAQAQITVSRSFSGTAQSTLEEQLINRLRATGLDQQNYLRFVVQKVQQGALDQKLVVAIERYALRRNPEFPFPFFERALRFEATKRRVALPSVRQFASTRATP